MHSTFSHHIDNCEMLQHSHGTLAVNRCIKLSLKAPAYKRFYASHCTLAQPYAYLPIELYDGDVGNDVKLKQQEIHQLIERTPMTVYELNQLTGCVLIGRGMVLLHVDYS